MEPLEKATAILSAALGVDAPEVAELLTSDDAVSQLAERFEAKLTDVRNKADQRTTSKTRTAVEKAFKAAGVEDASFDALPAAIEAIQAKAAAANPAALTEEQALKLPAVVKALNAERLKTDTAVADAVSKTKADLEADRQQFNQQRTAAAVRAAAEAEITRLNPNFTPGKEAAQKERLLKELLTDGRYQLDEKGEIQLVDEDGNVLPGKMGNGVARFADFVRDRADEAYGLPTAQPRNSPGMTQAEIDAGKGTKTLEHFKGELPKTADEYLKLANDTTLPYEARKEIRTHWEATQAAG